MDSTTPDPQPQQQQHQHQPQPMQQQQQQQQQQQHQHQQPPPRPQQQPHQPKPQQQQPHQQHQPPQQHQHPHQMHQQASPYPPMPAYHPSYYRHAAPYQQQFAYSTAQYVTNYAPQVTPYPPHQPWTQSPANYSPAQGQPMTNMVTQQPQTIVPQSHTKPSSQIINPVINPADQSHPLNLQSVAITNPALASNRQNRTKRVAILKDPETKEIIPLEDTSTPQTTTTITTTTSTTNIKASSTSSSSSATTTTPANAASSTSATTPPSTITTTTTTTPALATNKEEKNKKDVKKQEESSPTKIVQTKQQNPAQTLLQHVSEDGLETKNQIAKNGQDTKKVEAAANVIIDTTYKDKKVSPSSSSALEVQVASIPEEKIREKVNGNDDDNKGDSCRIVTKEIDSKIESPKKVSDVNLDKPEPSTPSNNGQDSKKNMETETPTTIDEATTDGDKSSTKVEVKQAAEDDAGNQMECKVNGNDGQDQNDDSNKEDQESDSKAELHYEPWQYNPVSNRTGKKIYSKQFMLDVCEKICKLGLSNKESDDKIGLENDGLQNAFSERFDMFAPAFSSSQRYTPMNRQNEPARRSSQHVYAGRSSAGQERQRKVITSVSLTQEVELKTVSNPWKRATNTKVEGTNDEVETESLKKKFRSILNKLTPNNFENLAKQVTDLCIDSESKLGEVIDIVFAKALAEPGYCVLYGQMCSHLKKITAGAAIFGNTLLKRCQHQFQSDIYSGLNLDDRKEKIENEQDPEVKKQLNEELYDEMYRCRMRGLGLIKFIGELYKIEMLNDDIMFDCVLRLLSDTSEESLECLCDLLATIGEKLDRSSQKNSKEEKKAPQKSAPKAVAYSGGQKSAAAVVASGSANSQQQKQAAANLQQQEQQFTVLTSLDQVFHSLHKIRKNKDLKLSVRIRFKLLDTCELREKENWQSKKTKDNNPKKIEEIREAHMEKLEQERRQQSAMGPRRSQEGRRGLGHSGGSSSQVSSMGNESSGYRGQSNMHTSSSSHLLRDHSLNDMNMKTNHNDIESHKEHQKKIENIKSMSIFNRIGTNTASSSSSADSLRPQMRLGRPAMNLRPNSSSTPASSSSSSSTAAAAAAAASAPSTGATIPTTTLSSSTLSATASKLTTTTSTPPAGVTEEKQEGQQQQES